MPLPLAAVAAGAALGGLAGSQAKKSYQNQTTTSSVSLRDINSLNRGRSALEAAADKDQMKQYLDLQALVGQGPGSAEVTANNQFQNSFANQLQGILDQIANPSQANINQNYQTAQALFAPEQTALNQQFQDQATASNRLAARLGRAGNDPILRNKLAQEQTRQQTMLNSQVGSYSRQLPQIQGQQMLDIGGALSNLRGGLASQALNNRQTLLGIGNQLQQAERNYRLQTATRTNATSGMTSEGGGLSGAISGALAGAGSFANLAGMFGGAGGATGGLGTPGANMGSYIRPTDTSVLSSTAVGSNRFISPY